MPTTRKERIKIAMGLPVTVPAIFVTPILMKA
jgi:hypothetical protein